MDYRHHARLTIYSREQLAKTVVEGRLGLREAAAAGVVGKLEMPSAFSKWAEPTSFP
jgi:hypothetical protein